MYCFLLLIPHLTYVFLIVFETKIFANSLYIRDDESEYNSYGMLRAGSLPDMVHDEETKSSYSPL
jgi:hypothetical protein